MMPSRFANATSPPNKLCTAKGRSETGKALGGTCQLELAALEEQQALGAVRHTRPAVFAIKGCQHKHQVKVEDLEADKLGAQRNGVGRLGLVVFLRLHGLGQGRRADDETAAPAPDPATPISQA